MKVKRILAAIMLAPALGAPAFGQLLNAPSDAERGVLSFADQLEPALASVVRIANFTRTETGGQTLKATGSGAIIDAGGGLVITNAHVVRGGSSFTVELRDGRRLQADLVGADEPTDLALLSVDPASLSEIDVADSDALRVGDLVFAVGYPLGLDQTLTFGIVSGLGRGGAGRGLQDFIQTDAAINSGNSGGPLLDSQGRLVGVNTAILSKSGGNIGIGFSTPSAIALRVAEQLEAYGEVRRGAIGVAIGDVTPEASRKAGYERWDGALIARVDTGSAAEAAGLEAGDVVVSFDGRPVRTPQALRVAIGVAQSGRAVSIGYVRGGVGRTTSVIPQPLKPPLVAGLEQLGAAIRPTRLSDPIPATVRGAWVRSVAPGSPADLAGLAPGDVIVGVNQELVSSPQHCDRLVSENAGRARLAVFRNGAVRPVLIQGA